MSRLGSMPDSCTMLDAQNISCSAEFFLNYKESKVISLSSVSYYRQCCDHLTCIWWVYSVYARRRSHKNIKSFPLFFMESKDAPHRVRATRYVPVIYFWHWNWIWQKGVQLSWQRAQQWQTGRYFFRSKCS